MGNILLPHCKQCVFVGTEFVYPKGVENNVASVSGKTEIESIPSNEPTPQMSQELKGSMTFDSSMDVATGLTLKSTAKGHIEGTTTMKNNGTEMKMPMVVDSESESTMTK